MNSILYILMVSQALSLPAIQKNYITVNPVHNFLFDSTSSSIEPSTYRIVIEASSTKVKQCLYYIDDAKKLQSVCVKVGTPIEQLATRGKKKVGGVESLFEGENGLKALLGKVTDPASKLPDLGQHVPVDVLATAGMRKLNLLEQTLIWQRYIDEWKSFTESGEGIYRRLQLYSIQDTSGVEEGTYGCIIANVAKGNLDLSLQSQNNVLRDWVGIAEIGGASVQIAVPREQKTTFDFENFDSWSIPFGKELFFEKVMEKTVPGDCRFNPEANFEGCFQAISNKIDGKFGKQEKLIQEKLERSGVRSFHLLGGVFGNAWALESNFFHIGDLKKMTEERCAGGGKTWNGEAAKNPLKHFKEMACYNAVFPYSILLKFLPKKIVLLYLQSKNVQVPRKI